MSNVLHQYIIFVIVVYAQNINDLRLNGVCLAVILAILSRVEVSTLDLIRMPKIPGQLFVSVAMTESEESKLSHFSKLS